MMTVPLRLSLPAVRFSGTQAVRNGRSAYAALQQPSCLSVLSARFAVFAQYIPMQSMICDEICSFLNLTSMNNNGFLQRLSDERTHSGSGIGA